MKRLIIRHKDFILKVHASENNTSILDSYKVKRPSDMKSIIKKIRVASPENYAINRRNEFSMVNEWRAHNLLYTLGIEKRRTASVDLNIGQPWYINLAYTIVSLFYLHFN